MIVRLPTVMRDGFAGDPVQIESADILRIIPRMFDADWFHTKVETSLVFMRGGTRIHSSLTRRQIQELIQQPSIVGR